MAKQNQSRILTRNLGAYAWYQSCDRQLINLGGPRRKRGGLHSNMGGERPLRTDSNRVTSSSARSQRSFVIRAHDERVTRRIRQILAPCSVLVDIVSEKKSQKSVLQSHKESQETYTRPWVGSAMFCQSNLSKKALPTMFSVMV